MRRMYNVQCTIYKSQSMPGYSDLFFTISPFIRTNCLFHLRAHFGCAEHNFTI